MFFVKNQILLLPFAVALSALSIALTLLVIKILIVIVDNLSILATGFRKEIRESVQSKFIEVSPNTRNVLDVAIEIWRIEQRLGKIGNTVEENQRKGLDSSLSRLKKFIDGYGIAVKDFTGCKYTSGMTALEVITVEKDPNASHDHIKETVEPALYAGEQLVRKAKVIVASPNAKHSSMNM